MTSEVICINNNVTNFIATLEALDFPRSAIFSLSDLESTGAEDRWGFQASCRGMAARHAVQEPWQPNLSYGRLEAGPV